MLPAAHRLRTAAEFQDTLRRGRRSARGSVVVAMAQHDSADPPRIGVITSKSVGNSVARHRAARRIREAVRPVLSDLPAGACVVIRALPGADRSPGLVSDVQDGLRRLVTREQSA